MVPRLDHDSGAPAHLECAATLELVAGRQSSLGQANAGLTVNVVKAMSMDFGDSAAPNPSGKMGAWVIQSAQATQAQILSVRPNLTAAQAWAMV